MSARRFCRTADIWTASGLNGRPHLNKGDRTNSRDQHNALVARMLRDRRKKEALEWLKGSTPDDVRLIGNCETPQASIALVKSLYALRAMEVIAVHIRTARKPTKCKRTGKLVVTLPENPEERLALLGWCEAQGESLGYTPESDHGESHLFLLLD